MTSALYHRGPDEGGSWIDERAGLALGHRRLSIIDLSPAGAQPMVSASGRFVIVFNGEIYNFEELREDLRMPSPDGPAFRGHSDTEVMLAAFERWGLDAALRRFNGMFAFALWDRRERTLHLARDRFGEKPLYYGWAGGQFLFASELKALRANCDFHPEISRDALATFLRYGNVPAPYCIYRGISKLPPAVWLTVKADGRPSAPKEYWSLQAAAAGMDGRLADNPELAAEELDALLRQAVRMRMVSDVPLGAFLSGGVDSSAVVALMQSQSATPVKTFTIGFSETRYDESKYAKAVACHLGTEHTAISATPEETLQVIPRLPAIYDEPFADSSQISTFLVSQLARRHVTVSLSGDGADEVFGGYPRYFGADLIWKKIAGVPAPVRRITAGLLRSVPPRVWESVPAALDLLAPARLRLRNPVDKMQKLAEALVSESQRAMYLRMQSTWPKPEEIALNASELPTLLSGGSAQSAPTDFAQWMMFADTATYLPDDILVKVDRASMAVGLESRAPYLDHRVVEYAWRLPVGLKIRNGEGKWLLRRVLSRYVPPALFERPKAGFAIPIHAWLRGPLCDWAEALLNESRLRREAYLAPVAIRRKWAEHLSGARNWSYQLWSVLMFQAWLENQ